MMNKKIQSTNYSNCKFSLAYENYLNVYILYISSDEKKTLILFSFDYISTNNNDISRV